jgi:putative copper export protein/methionine-rich copper-binding protein CopC
MNVGVRGLCLLGLLLFLLPGRAFAHAAVAATQPEPGQRLALAPGAVLISFTEPINPTLSRARVLDPTGRAFDGIASPDTGIRVPLATDAPGIYRVEWTTVSTLDGHTLRGAYTFGVRVDAGQLSTLETQDDPGRADILLAVPRALEYAALLMALGMALLRLLAARKPALPWVRFRHDLALAAALGSGFVVLVGEATIAAGRLDPSAIGTYLSNGPPGAARLFRLADEAAALMFALPAPSLAVPPLIGAVAALSAAGHAAAVRPPWTGIFADTIHFLSAGAWLGSILALATLKPPGGWRGEQARLLLARFSPIALPAFLLTIATGTLRGSQELQSFSDLATTSYGIMLSIKVLAVAAMIPLSLAAWRRTFRPRSEAVLASVVLGAAAILATYPLPPGRVAEAETARAAASAQNIALPRAGDLALGERAGDTLVGLTVRSGQPGANELYLTVVPASGATGSIPTELTIDGRTVALEGCGQRCQRAGVDLRGGESVTVQTGPTAAATFIMPALPAPDGQAVIEKMTHRMRLLHTVRFVEQLGPVVPPIETTTTMVAPDRVESQVTGGGHLIWIGETRYLRDAPDQPWRVEDTGFALPAPAFVWDPPAIDSLMAAHVVGTEAIGGVPTQIVSFFGRAGALPVWFKLWVDDEGLVHRAEMRAEAHFMDHRYTDFDAPLVIEPPPADGGP